jgi:hypothetical protein
VPVDVAQGEGVIVDLGVAGTGEVERAGCGVGAGVCLEEGRYIFCL